jgi:hypothetical protein
MSGMPWVKLHTDVLDDVKFNRLNATAQILFFKLIALAGECDTEGYLIDGSVKYNPEDIAWRLHMDPVEVARSLNELIEADMVEYDPKIEALLLVHFAERQGRPQEEKRAGWRERQDSHRGNAAERKNVTRDNKVTNEGVTPLEEEEEKRESREEGEGEKPAPPQYPDDFPFENMMPKEYDRVPELKLYKRVTKRIPGTLQLKEIVLAIRRNALRERDLVEPWRQWAILHAYRPDSLVWLTEWVPAVKRGEKPWEFKRNGGQAETVPKARTPNQVSPEQVLKDLMAGQNAKPSVAQ